MNNMGFPQSDEYNPEKERNNIRSKLSKLSSRLLYVTIQEIYQDNIYFKEDVDYLTNKLIILKVTAEELVRHINVAKDIILDDEAVDWICKDLRVALWFDHYISNKCHGQNNTYILKFRDTTSTSYIKNCIRKFDACRITINPDASKTWLNRSKVNRIERNRRLKNNNTPNAAGLSSLNSICTQLKINFIDETKIKYNFNRTNYKNLDWLDKKDELQLLWAKDYLFSQKLLIHSNAFFAESLNELYDQICASMDAIDIDSTYLIGLSKPESMSLRKKDILRKMRGAWSQKKFRDKKDAESALEHFLTRRHRNMLKELANDHRVTSKEYIQQLIDETYNSTE